MLFEPRHEASKRIPSSSDTELQQDEDNAPAKSNSASAEKEDNISDKKIKKPTATNSKSSTQHRNNGDRYAILQRKVEELERIHNDSKKAHQADVNRLKAELARHQKCNADFADRQEKQRKHSDGLEARIQDLKKATVLDQAEIKDLRSKLRISENQRNQMTTKQGDVAELRRSLQTLQTKLGEETRTKDRRISDLEKTLVLEKTGKDKVEAELQSLIAKSREELQMVQTLSRKREIEAEQATSRLLSLEQSSRKQDEETRAHLKDCHLLMTRVSQEYGHLAQNTVSMDAYDSFQRDHTVLQIQLLRTERKLANSEAQVNELAHLIRYTKEENMLLSKALEETKDDIAFYQGSMRTPPPIGRDDLDHSLFEISEDVQHQRAEARADFDILNTRSAELLLECYRLTCGQALSEYALTYEHLRREQEASGERATTLSNALASHETITAQLDSVQKEKTRLKEQLQDAIDLAESLKEASTQYEITLKKERDTVRRLTDTVQRSRMAEDALRSEIQRLTAEVADAEKYQEAYYSLSDEVGSLVARNQLAEEEASILSKFNAEILSHNNPAQRVMYVDRIRRELAETKHKLLMLEQEQEAAMAVNNDLRQELDMYRSVMIPADLKPRTTITRVTRAPFISLTNSVNGASTGKPSTDGVADNFAQKAETPYIRTLESIPGDMTIEEIS